MSDIKHVVIVGSGLMGSQIGCVAASAGFDVSLIDLDFAFLEKSRESVHKTLERMARKLYKTDEKKISDFIENSLSRIQWSNNLKETVKTADIVIEAIVEKLDAKQKMFAAIDDIAKPSAIFASNTSSLPIKEIAKTSKRLDRFCGLHFFNPVPVMKLLEVIRIPETSEETYETVMKFGKKLGKVTVTCKDTPGFIVNRLLNPYFSEAYQMVERGDATVKDIDVAMKLGAGYPLGPFELTDLIGIDTARNVRQYYHECFPDNPLYNASPLLDKMVREGKLGVKSGEGFYNYKK